MNIPKKISEHLKEIVINVIYTKINYMIVYFYYDLNQIERQQKIFKIIYLY